MMFRDDHDDFSDCNRHERLTLQYGSCVFLVLVERYRALAKELGLNPNTPVAKDPKAKGAKTRPNLIF